MPEMTSYTPGTPSWVDLGSPDIPGSIAFYKEVFGWEAADTGDEGGGYQMLMKDGKYVAGLGPAMNPGPPYWTTYVSVADVDDTVQRVEKEGGTVVMPPMDVLDAGRMAVASDPTGAFFSMWQPNMHIGAQLVNEHGTLCWNELSTRDTDKAAAFYTAVFGWEAKTSSTEGGEGGGDPGMAYTEFQVDGRSIAGMMAMMPDMPAEVPSHWLVYFAVDDCEAAVAKVTAAGGKVVTPPMDISSVGRFSVVQDPQGAVFAVIALATPPG